MRGHGPRPLQGAGQVVQRPGVVAQAGAGEGAVEVGLGPAGPAGQVGVEVVLGLPVLAQPQVGERRA